MGLRNTPRRGADRTRVWDDALHLILPPRSHPRTINYSSQGGVDSLQRVDPASTKHDAGDAGGSGLRAAGVGGSRDKLSATTHRAFLPVLEEPCRVEHSAPPSEPSITVVGIDPGQSGEGRRPEARRRRTRGPGGVGCARHPDDKNAADDLDARVGASSRSAPRALVDVPSPHRRGELLSSGQIVGRAPAAACAALASVQSLTGHEKPGQLQPHLAQGRVRGSVDKSTTWQRAQSFVTGAEGRELFGMRARIDVETVKQARADEAEENGKPVRDVLSGVGVSRCGGIMDLHDIRDAAAERKPEMGMRVPWRAACQPLQCSFRGMAYRRRCRRHRVGARGRQRSACVIGFLRITRRVASSRARQRAVERHQLLPRRRADFLTVRLVTEDSAT